jgi:muramoyltetrapeptide carboxypeptidase LdcA involved in peptidoglycan recycling
VGPIGSSGLPWNVPRSGALRYPSDTEQRAECRRNQRQAVLRALSEYAPDMLAVFDVDLGHTDPQLVIPYGGTVTVDGPARRITIAY